MSFEDDLSRRLRSSVDGVSARPDLADVEARAEQVVRRRRIVLGASVGALVVLAIGSLALVRGRDSEGTVTAPPESAPAATEPVDTLPPATSPPDTEPGDIVEPTIAPTSDRADPYLAGSTEIYRRTLPNGDVFVARLSDESYASVFGLEWRAPTGSADACLGDHAVFIGVPDRAGYWGSAWVATPWFDDADLTGPVVVASMMSAAGGPMVDPTTDDASHQLLRMDPGVREVVVTARDGTELDRAEVIDGLAMVAVPSSWTDGDGPPLLSTVGDDGRTSEATPINYDARPPQVPDDPCSPGAQPPRPLPGAGEQPDDPVEAEAEIRERHALLVDRAIPADEKPQDLLDDDTGVADAVADAREGTYAESVAGASYRIDELVFTAPDEAWFRYTITAPTGTFSDRFGTATFNGSVWQISRASICSDLSLAGGDCGPPYVTIEPPANADWDAENQAWMERASLYMAGDGCSPISQC